MSRAASAATHAKGVVIATNNRTLAPSMSGQALSAGQTTASPTFAIDCGAARHRRTRCSADQPRRSSSPAPNRPHTGSSILTGHDTRSIDPHGAVFDYAVVIADLARFLHQ
jgi:hypothetical protein